MGNKCKIDETQSGKGINNLSERIAQTILTTSDCNVDKMFQEIQLKIVCSKRKSKNFYAFTSYHDSSNY